MVPRTCRDELTSLAHSVRIEWCARNCLHRSAPRRALMTSTGRTARPCPPVTLRCARRRSRLRGSAPRNWERRSNRNEARSRPDCGGKKRSAITVVVGKVTCGATAGAYFGIVDTAARGSSMILASFGQIATTSGHDHETSPRRDHHEICIRAHSAGVPVHDNGRRCASPERSGVAGREGLVRQVRRRRLT